MNTQEEFSDKLLRSSLNPGSREKAPDGFTEKIMNLVALEAKPVNPSVNIFSRSKVPLVYALFTLALVAAALLLHLNGSVSSADPTAKIFGEISKYIRAFDPSSVFTLSLPGYLPYLFLSVLFLTVLDLGLKGMFQKGK